MSDDDGKVVSIGGGSLSAQTVRNAPDWFVPIENVLAGTNPDDLTEILIVGRLKSGELRMASSHSDAHAALMLLHAQWHLGKQIPLEGEFDG